MKFYSSVRMEVRRVESLKQGSDIIGNRTRVKVVKNKVAPPFKTAEFDIMYGKGISKIGELVDIGVDLGIVNKSGSWFSYGDIRLGQGRENTKEFFNQNPELAKEVEEKIRLSREKMEEEKNAGQTGEAAPAPAATSIKRAQVPKKAASAKNIDIEVDE